MNNKDIVLNYCPPSSIFIPSAALSVLKPVLEQNNYKTKVIYWNLKLYYLQNAFVWNNLNYIVTISPLNIYLNYIAIKNNDNFIYQNIKRQLQVINPKYLNSDSTFYDSHMEKYALLLEQTLDEIISEYDLSNTLYWGFSLKMEQWLFASILAKKIKTLKPDMPIIVGGIDTDITAKSFLENFPQFDIAVWGEGEDILLNITHELNKKTTPDFSKIDNIIYQKNNQIFFSKKSARHFSNLSEPYLFPDFADFFEQRKKASINEVSAIPIEGSRGCHWNRCHFCYLSLGYKYRQKSLEKIISEITYMIQKYNVLKFQFLDNDIIGNDLGKFEILLDSFIKIKDIHDSFDIILAEVITKGLNKSIIKKMALAGFSNVQIGYESTSDKILRKIEKKNTFSSNLNFIKHALHNKIRVGGTNIITGLIEETSEDILDAIDNLRFLRFFFDQSLFKHTLLALCMNANSKYANKIDPKYKEHLKFISMLSFLTQHYIKEEHQWNIFDYGKTSNNILWDSFIKLEKYYLQNKHSYTITSKDNKITYNEIINRQVVFSHEMSTNSLDYTILQHTNDKVISLENLIPIINKKEKFSNNDITKKINFLFEKGIIYHTENHDEIISIINIDNLQNN